VDLPLVPVQALELFHALPRTEQIVAPRVGERVHFACALYPRSALPILRLHRSRGEYRLTALLAALPHRLLEEDELPFLRSEPRAFFNLNLPSDLEALRRMERPGAGSGKG
jgi:molybdopterin-guanine dinucleotide biosynthesis protein A